MPYTYPPFNKDYYTDLISLDWILGLIGESRVATQTHENPDRNDKDYTALTELNWALYLIDTHSNETSTFEHIHLVEKSLTKVDNIRKEYEKLLNKAIGKKHKDSENEYKGILRNISNVIVRLNIISAKKYLYLFQNSAQNFILINCAHESLQAAIKQSSFHQIIFKGSKLLELEDLEKKINAQHDALIKIISREYKVNPLTCLLIDDKWVLQSIVINFSLTEHEALLLAAQESGNKLEEIRILFNLAEHYRSKASQCLNLKSQLSYDYHERFLINFNNALNALNLLNPHLLDSRNELSNLCACISKKMHDFLNNCTSFKTAKEADEFENKLIVVEKILKEKIELYENGSKLLEEDNLYKRDSNSSYHRHCMFHKRIPSFDSYFQNDAIKFRNAKRQWFGR